MTKIRRILFTTDLPDQKLLSTLLFTFDFVRWKSYFLFFTVPIMIVFNGDLFRGFVFAGRPLVLFLKVMTGQGDGKQKETPIRLN